MQVQKDKSPGVIVARTLAPRLPVTCQQYPMEPRSVGFLLRAIRIIMSNGAKKWGLAVGLPQ